jgi:hypothetical protein
MRVKTAALVAWLSLLLCCLAAPVPALASAGRRHPPPAHASIVGGRPASIAELPWLAFIEGEDPGGARFSCSGSVVAPRVVLTAGHCVEEIETSIIRRAGGYVVTTGLADVSRPPAANRSRVSRALIYPHFRPARLWGDAGILVLASPVSAPSLPLAGAADGTLLEAQTPISISGWGLTSPEAGRTPAALQTAATLVQSPEYCKRSSAPFYPIYSPARQLCAVDPPDFAISGCFGDSGGPAIAHRADATPVEVGIVSTGGPECSTSLPNIFTRVDTVSSWVSRWVAAVEFGGPVPAVRIPRVRLPVMSPFIARIIGSAALARDFRGHFRRGHDRRIDCRRVKRERARCAVAWRQGGDDYFGTIAVYFAVEDGRELAKHRYRIHWVDERCRRQSLHPRRCAVRTRLG